MDTLESVCRRLQLAEKSLAQHQTQLQDIQDCSNKQTAQLTKQHQSAIEQQVQVDHLNLKIINIGMQVGTHKNSITFIETNIAAQSVQLRSLADQLDDTKLRLLNAKGHSQDLHNNLQEQLQVQASHLSDFTSMCSQFIQSLGGTQAIASPALPAPAALPALPAPVTTPTDLNMH
ncbi:hypothetical protein ACA910_022068 [Epithemia clementina (nom. ined.)]